MDLKLIKIVPISIYSDEILNFSYVKVLSEERFETIKLPLKISRYKFQHLLKPINILEVEIVKTRKNWILQNILCSESLFRFKNYVDYTKVPEIQKILLNYFQDGLETDLLNELKKLLDKNELSDINIKNFEEFVQKNMGFL